MRILSGSDGLHTPRLSASALVAAIVVLFGLAILLRCVWDFLAAGHGTLAPVDPPTRLVVRGLYRVTRNPMYNGVLVMVAGEAWLCSSAALMRYALSVFVGFHAFVVLYEERRSHCVSENPIGLTVDGCHVGVSRHGRSKGDSNDSGPTYSFRIPSPISTQYIPPSQTLCWRSSSTQQT